MAYNALQVMNKLLKRAQLIQGSSQELSDFTDSRVQHSIDVMLNT